MTLTDPSTCASRHANNGMNLAMPPEPAQRSRRSPIEARTPSPILDVTIPAFNDEASLEENLRRLHGYLKESFPHTFRITVADNASTDNTLRIAERLARELPEVFVVRFEQRGRGNALRQVWLASPSPVLAYMEADLSTDLSAVAPLLAPLISGHSDLAIGTRLVPASRVTRSPRHQFVARSYNSLLRTVLGAEFSDAQCGFKAIRADAAHQLLPHVKDDAWFFDTELLIIAERSGLRIHEVPVDWTQDPNSSVDVVRTAIADLRGIGRLTRDLRRGRIPVRELRAALSAGPAPSPRGSILGRVVPVVAWSLAYLGIFLACNGYLNVVVANVLGLALASWAVRPHLGLPGFVTGLAVSSGALLLLPLITTPDRWLEGAAIVGAALTAAVVGIIARRT